MLSIDCRASGTAPLWIKAPMTLIPEPRNCPTPELSVDTGPLAKFFWQVTPRRTRSCNPENPIKNNAVVGRFASVRSANSQDEVLEEQPLLVRHEVSFQVGLHCTYQLEPRSAVGRNPFCQHVPVLLAPHAFLFMPLHCLREQRHFAYDMGLEILGGRSRPVRADTQKRKNPVRMV